MTEFTPLPATLGGLLIGAAAVLLLLANGRIAGISGILGGLLTSRGGEATWRAAFLVGLPLGALLAGWLRGGLPVDVSAGPFTLAIAGLLVGFGTRLGSGCTSGHGVCGMGRGSPRSIAATLVFVSAGVVTVTLVRHVLGSPG